jgi:DNA-binding XRE family transcriptional regulator
MTQPAFAKMIGVSLPTLCRIERGCSVSLLTRLRVEKMLSLKVEAA